MSDVPPPEVERTYRYPAKARWSYGAAALACAAMAAGGVGLQFAPYVDSIERGQLLIFTAVFVALARHAADAAKTLAGEVRLAHAGVGDGRELVAWPDVARVEIQPLRQRMDLFTAAGRRFLSIRPELEAFAAVQDYILAHMQPRACSPPCSIPLLSPLAGAPLAVFCALLAVWWGPQRGVLPSALFAGISVLFVLVYLARRRSLRVEPDRVVLRQGWRRLAIAYREIAAVHLQARPRPRGGSVHYVVLERAQAESVPIAGFRRGYHEAYHCIESAWRAARS